MSADLLEKIENRRARIRRTVTELREEINRLGDELAAAEHTLERLEITHQTVVDLTTEDTPTPTDPLPDGYRDVLALFTQDGEGLRAKDACRALGAGTEPRHVEGLRAKLKRLVDRGVLTEPEPGLFILPRPTPPTPEINPN